MATRKIYNIKSIQARNYNILDLGLYASYMGKPESKFVAMNYGGSGSGKSVHALKFSDFYARHYGKVLYNSHEEAIHKTIQDRINDFEISAPKLYVGDRLSYEEMCYKIERNYYRLAVIDSVQYMNFTMPQLHEMRERFKKRNLSILMVSFGDSKGNPTNAKPLLHASDIKLFFKDGKVHSHGRYLSKPVDKVLFVPNQTVQQGKLFD